MTEQKNDDMHEVSRLRFDCPHCGSFMKVRTSKTHLPEYRELYLNCTNEFQCGYRCKATLSVSETLAFSYCPNPDVNIKPSSWLERQIGLEAQGQMRLNDPQPLKKESP